MVFLSDPRPALGRRQFSLRAATLAAIALATGVSLVGCSGGKSTPSPSPTATPNTSAAVFGRINESTSATPVSGAVVRFSGLAVTTDVSGTFMFSVPGGGEARAITVELPTGQYFNYGEQRGQCLENISGAGITVAKSDLEVGDQTDVGEIRVFSADGPPPPPCKF